MTQEQVHRINEAFRELQQATFEAGAAFNCTVIGMIDGGKLLLVSTSMVSKAATDGSPKVFLELPVKSTGKPITVEVTPKAASQWQTGPIPDPTGRSVVFVEKRLPNKDTTFFSETKAVLCEDEWIWQQNANDFLKSAHATGRWYIQNIILPTTPNQ